MSITNNLLYQPTDSGVLIDCKTKPSVAKLASVSTNDLKKSGCINMKAQLIGYEAGSQASTNPKDGLTWICQLESGIRVIAPLKCGIIVSAFDAMHLLGTFVQISCRSITQSGEPVLPFISNLNVTS